MGVETFYALKSVEEKGHYWRCDGGFAPNIKSNEEALDLVLESIQKVDTSRGNSVIWLWTSPANFMRIINIALGNLPEPFWIRNR
jgi:enolase